MRILLSMLLLVTVCSVQAEPTDMPENEPDIVVPAELPESEAEAETDAIEKASTEEAPAMEGGDEAETDTETNGKSSKPMFGPGITSSKNDRLKKPEVDISMWKYMLSLLLVLGLIAFFFFGLKKLTRKLGGGGYGSLQVVRRLQLDGKNYLVMVKFHEEEILLSVGPNGTNLISRNASLDGDVKLDGETAEADTDEDGVETTEVDNSGSNLLSKLFKSGDAFKPRKE